MNPIDSEAIVTAVNDANHAYVAVFMQNLITPVGQGNVIVHIGYYQWKGAAQLAKFLQGELVPRVLETPAVVVDKTNLDDCRTGRTWKTPMTGQPELDKGQQPSVDLP